LGWLAEEAAPGDAEVLARQARRDASPRRAGQEALVDQERLDDVFERALVLADGGGERLEPDRAAVELLEQGAQQGEIEAVEAGGVDLEALERETGPRAVDQRARSAVDLGEVAHPAQQAVRDPRRSARARCEHAAGIRAERDAEHPRRALKDPLEVRRRVVLQARDPPEAIAQRRREQAGARGGADQREARQIEAHRARARSLSDQDVELEVLHRRVEDLLDRRRQPVDLVDEEHVAGFQVG
jgi:hypothetical protein